MSLVLTQTVAMGQQSPVQALTGFCQSGTGAYVLIDPMLGEPLPDMVQGVAQDSHALVRAREQTWGRTIFTVSLATGTPLHVSQYPYLVELEGPSDPWWQTTWEMAAEASLACLAEGVTGEGGGPLPIGGWLISAMGQQALVDALGDLFRLRADAQTRARYLRLADPRVMALVQRVVGTARIAGALGRIQIWLHTDLLGQLAVLESTGEVPQPLQFARHEWQILEKGESLNRSLCMALGLLRAEGAAPSLRLTEQAEAALGLAAQAARRWPERFAHPRDHQAWAALCLARGDLGSHPAVVELMAPTPPGEDEPLPTVRTLAGTLAAVSRPTHPQDRSKLEPGP